MSNKLFINMLQQYKKIVDKEIGIIDDTGKVIICTEVQKQGEYKPDIIEEFKNDKEMIIKNKYTFLPIKDNEELEFAVYIYGDDDESIKFLSLIAVTMTNLRSLYDEKFNKSSFIKNIITDNILPGDIFIKSKELNFKDSEERIVYLIKFPVNCEYNSFDIIQNLYPDKNKDFVININENDIVLVKELKIDSNNHKSNEIEVTAKQIVDTVNAEYYIKIMVGIGSPVSELKDLSRSFKEAQIALEVGKVFDNEKDIINFKNLGIGRIIYQLPTTLCEVFLQEVFKSGSLESLDRESLATIQSFFENDLNVSVTSRKLFIHRNTLVYRLEKIKKLTGLDLREFEHAIIFKVALMVKKYLSSKPIKY